jgi:peptidoglycan/LPS O-acetylase OafA/YrhL
MESRKSYRPDIDGLRAIAVLCVVIYHFGFRIGEYRLYGCFIGVDVFFVISGYLISSIILSELSSSRFSIAAFYEGRIRRIFPALFVLLLASSAFCAFYLLPRELVEYGNSLLAVSAFASNFYFSQHAQYFNAPTTVPMLHTWSLAVEEQFYILFPLLLILSKRFWFKWIRHFVCALFFLSLLASMIAVDYRPDSAFYMLYSRAWELLLGTILSLGLFPSIRSRWHRSLLTLTGITMILAAALLYSANTPFPGFAALLPCLGATFVLGAGESGTSWVASALAWRPLAFVGLISYSLYLWHWPVIVARRSGDLISWSSILARYFPHIFTPYKYDLFFDSLFIFGVSVLSWTFVERPFRSGSLRLSGWKLFSFAGGLILVLLTFSATTILSGGFSYRFSPQVVKLASYLDNEDNFVPMRTGTCFITATDSFAYFNRDLCLHRDPTRKNYLLLGDSHAAMLWDALSFQFPDVNIMQANAGGCRPFIHPNAYPVRPESCTEMMNYIFLEYLPRLPVDGLLLAGRWLPEDTDRIAETIAWARMHHIPVVLFGPLPEYNAPLPRLLAISVANGDPDLVRRHLLPANFALDAKLQDLAENSWRQRYVSLTQASCSKQVCTEFADDAHSVPLLFDDNHLSRGGARLILSRMANRRILRDQLNNSSLLGSSAN